MVVLKYCRKYSKTCKKKLVKKYSVKYRKTCQKAGLKNNVSNIVKLVRHNISQKNVKNRRFLFKDIIVRH